MNNPIRIAVVAINAEGAPDFFTTIVEVIDEQYDSGDHYDIAVARAEAEGFERLMIPFDPNDAAGRLLAYVHAFMEGRTDEAWSTSLNR